MRHSRAAFLAILTLAVVPPAAAQDPSEAPASEVGPEPPAAPVEMSKKERIELCRKKRGVPLEPSDSAPSRSGGEVSRPELIHHLQPRPPRSGIAGTVILEAIIDEDGCVREVRILKGLSKKQDAAVSDTLREWVFRPATLAGRPVRVYYVLTVKF